MIILTYVFSREELAKSEVCFNRKLIISYVPKDFNISQSHT